MRAWCGRARRRALLVLACVLLAVAAAPAVGSELLARPVAALLLLQQGRGEGAPAGRGAVQAPGAVVARCEARALPWAPREGGGGDALRGRGDGREAARDERHLYARHAKLLC